ncbi:MAG TPA: acetoacetyl-CoA reductase [Pusillimonas sp.]|uniref:acetoacetyl-CoA reductase n=1 Tax=Pusillimonas sp. TaxID=3040095 RepID=UPI002C740C85|nr:acetoacetyl-CoA reductase [Pusillimonas sp.]HUH87537.1 acetoacetyl-CoA reductase [Pusillimonas sp.]
MSLKSKKGAQVVTIQRTALVTGGFGTLGLAIARALQDAGHKVLLTYFQGHGDVSGDYAQGWLKQQAVEGYEFEAYPVDVADYASTQALADRLQADGHEVDILVNNAGITRDATLRKLSKENWDAVLRTNLDSAYNMTKPFIDGLLERGWGRIVNISSVNGSKGQFGQTNYSAAKAGLHGFTKSLALEVARKGITVNTISPGYLNTPMVAEVPKDILESQIIPQIPIGRLGEPAEVADLVVYVVSENAAFLTGSNLAINGGQHLY